MKCMNDLMAASRVFLELGRFPRVVSSSFKNATTSGALSCSNGSPPVQTTNREGPPSGHDAAMRSASAAASA